MNEHVVSRMGMARGILDDLDADVAAGGLVPFAGPSLCVLDLVGR